MYILKNLQEDLKKLTRRLTDDIQVIAGNVPLRKFFKEKTYLAKLIYSLNLALQVIYEAYQHISEPLNVLDQGNQGEIEGSPTKCDQSHFSSNIKEMEIFTNEIEEEINKIVCDVNQLIYKLDRLIYGYYIDRLELTLVHLTHQYIRKPLLLGDEKTPCKEPINSGDFLSNRVITPLLPGREDIFLNVENNHHVDPIFKSIHSGLTCLEIPTIEVCCSILNDFNFSLNHMEFINDICSQIYDEARHAEILYSCLKKAGYGLGLTPIHHRFWNMCYGESLDVRLVIHQKFGEWIGIDAALFRIKERELVSDDYIKNMYESILVDELQHVKLGNVWSRLFSNDYKKTIDAALAKRKIFNENDEGPLKFEHNPEMCAASGFASEEIEGFYERQLKFGAINKLNDLTIKEMVT